MAKGKSEPEFTEDLQKLAKEKLASKVVALRPDKDAAEPVADLHAHQIELEMQNEELRRAQEELEQSRRKYTDLFDFAPIGYFVIDKKRVIVEANLAGAALLGMEKDKLVNTSFSAYVDKSSSDALYLHQQKIFVEGQRDECELKLIRSDKTFIYVRILCEPVKDVDGSIIQCRTAVTDITERKQAEDAVRKSEERYRRLIENLKGTHFIYVHDTKGVFIYLSDAITEILGYTTDEFMTHYSKYMTDHPVNKAVHEHTALSIQGVRQPPYHVNVRHKDGSTRWLEVQEVPVFDPQGKVVAVEGVAQDITERRQAQEGMANLNSLLSSTIESTFNGILVVDRKSKITRYNRKFAQMWRIPDAVLATHEDKQALDFVKSQLSDPEGFLRRVQQLYDDPEAETFDMINFKDGRVFERYSRPQKIEGETVGRVWTFHDITKRRDAEEKLRASEEKFRALTETTSDWVWQVDEHGVYTYASPKVRDLLGYEPNEVIGKTPFDFMPADEAERVGAAFQAILKSQKPFVAIENVNLHKDGRRVVLETSGVPFFNAAGKLLGYRGIDRDITERKQMEMAIQTSERKFRAIFEQAPLGTALHDSKTGQFLEVNQKYCEFIGRTREELLKIDFQTVTYPEDLQADLDNMELLREGKISYYSMEKRYTRPDGSIIWGLLTVVPMWQEGEPVNIHIAIVMDITERKKAEEMLRESEEKFKTIFNSSIDGILIADMENKKFLMGNEAICKMLGYSLDEIKKLTVMDIHPKEGLPSVKEVFEKMRHGEIVYGENIPVKRRDGSIFYADINSTLVTLSGKKYAVGSFRDITERKQAEAALRESEERFASFMNNSPTISWMKDEDGRYVYLSKTFETRIGVKLEDWKGKTDFELWPKETAQQFRKNDLTVLKSWKPLEVIEETQEPDGSRCYSLNIKFPFKDAAGKKYVGGIGLDITERKQAEEALRQSEATYRALIETTSTGFVIIDRQGRVIEANPEYVRLTGHRNLDEIRGRSVIEWTADYEKEKNANAVKECFEKGKVKNLEIDYVDADGKITPVEINATMVEIGGDRQILTLCRDITERKKAEAALHESERFVKSVAEASPYWFYVFDLDKMGLSYANRPILRSLGYPEDAQTVDMLDAFREFMPPEEMPHLARVLEEWNTLPGGRVRGDEYRLRHADGTIHYFEGREIVFTRRPDGTVKQVLGLLLDMTDRKLAQEELKQTRQQLQDVIDGTTAAIILVKDLEGRFIAVNRCFEKFASIPREKLRGKTDYDVLSKGQADISRGYDKQALKSGPVQAEETLSFINGEDHVFLANRFPLYDLQGKPYAVCTIAPEITQRKQLEEELRKARDGLEAKVKERTEDLNEAVGLLQDEIDRRKKTQDELSKSEQRYRSLVEASAQIIWTTNAKGEMVEDNPPWNAFTGQTFEQGKGLGWFNVIHPDDKEYANTLMQEVLKSPRVLETEIRARRADGQYRHLAVRVVPVLEKDGSVREWIGTCTDITESKETREKIQQDDMKLRSLTTQLIITEEQQWRKIAETLHDSIGPLLAFSERQLESLIKQAPEKMAGVLEEVKHYINDVTKQTRSLTADLSPSSLYDLGLEAAVEELAEQFAKDHKLKVSLKISDEPKPLTEETKVLLYRSVREILVNIAKHAEAKTGRISIARTEKNIVIAIRDDGKGFDPSSLDAKAAKFKGLGLFSIRERVTQLGGCVDIQSQEGKGTTITLTAPLDLSAETKQ